MQQCLASTFNAQVSQIVSAYWSRVSCDIDAQHMFVFVSQNATADQYLLNLDFEAALR